MFCYAHVRRREEEFKLAEEGWAAMPQEEIRKKLALSADVAAPTVAFTGKPQTRARGGEAEVLRGAVRDTVPPDFLHDVHKGAMAAWSKKRRKGGKKFGPPTYNEVVKVVALAIIMAGKEMDIRQQAKLAEMSVDRLRRLRPLMGGELDKFRTSAILSEAWSKLVLSLGGHVVLDEAMFKQVQKPRQGDREKRLSELSDVEAWIRYLARKPSPWGILVYILAVRAPRSRLPFVLWALPMVCLVSRITAHPTSCTMSHIS